MREQSWRTFSTSYGEKDLHGNIFRFRASVRAAIVGSVSDVVAPPYDIIDAAGQKALHDRHPQNIIRLELGLDQPGDRPANNRYTRAAPTLQDWLKSGALKRDAQPAIYYHTIEYTPPYAPIRVRRRKLSRDFSSPSNWKRSTPGISTRMKIHARPPKQTDSICSKPARRTSALSGLSTPTLKKR